MDTRTPHGRVTHSLCDAERGATAVEHSVMLAAIAAVIVAFVFSMSIEVVDLFDSFLARLGAVLGS